MNDTFLPPSSQPIPPPTGKKTFPLFLSHSCFCRKEKRNPPSAPAAAPEDLLLLLLEEEGREGWTDCPQFMNNFVSVCFVMIMTKGVRLT